MENQKLYDMLIFEEARHGLLLVDILSEYKNEIEELVIPDSWNVTEICKPHSLFLMPLSSCKKLRRVRLPSTLKRIDNAFNHCEELEEVIFPENLECIGNNNFGNNKKLKSIKLPSGLKCIGFDNFSGKSSALMNDANNWTSDGCFYIDNYLIKCESTQETLTIREGTTLIAACACQKLRLRKVIFPESLRYIGTNAFYYCPMLEKPILPEKLKYLAKNAFDSTGPNYRDGEYFNDCYVTEGYFSDNGHLCLEMGLGYISSSKLKEVAEYMSNYLLRVECIASYVHEDEYTLDTIDKYEESKIVYCTIDVFKDREHLIRINDEIKGVVFCVRDSSSQHKLDEYAFLFDESVQSSFTTGHTGDHSSSYFTIDRVTLVRKGINGVPDQGEKIRFNRSAYESRL